VASQKHLELAIDEMMGNYLHRILYVQVDLVAIES